MIPASVHFDQSTLASMLAVDPLVKEYRTFFALFDWSVVDRWQAARSACYGSHGHPLTAYLKAFLLRITRRLDLRQTIARVSPQASSARHRFRL
jgi:hypothetical protein